jgi:hypothetical protein
MRRRNESKIPLRPELKARQGSKIASAALDPTGFLA